MVSDRPSTIATIVGVGVGALIVVVVYLVAIRDAGGNSNAAPQFSNMLTMVAHIRAAGLGCADFTDTTNSSDGISIGTDYSFARGECTIEGEQAKLELYKDRGAQEHQRGQAIAIACSIGKSFGITSFAFVEGAQWMIAPKTETVARDVAAKMRGQAEVHTCP